MGRFRCLFFFYVTLCCQIHFSNEHSYIIVLNMTTSRLAPVTFGSTARSSRHLSLWRHFSRLWVIRLILAAPSCLYITYVFKQFKYFPKLHASLEADCCHCSLLKQTIKPPSAQTAERFALAACCPTRTTGGRQVAVVRERLAGLSDHLFHKRRKAKKKKPRPQKYAFYIFVLSGPWRRAVTKLGCDRTKLHQIYIYIYTYTLF